jgi:hypothetical protein
MMTGPTVQQYDQLLRGGQPNQVGGVTAPATPMLPAYNAGAGGSTLDRRNIDFLLNPNFNTFETDTNAAEAAVGGGVAGSGFAGNVRNNMLDSERIRRMQLGNQMLEPYLQRDFQAGQGAADRASALQRAILEGNQAMERLQLSEAGQTARLSQAQRAEMERLAEQGRQAMQQLSIREAGESSRLNTSIGGTLANTALSGLLRGGGATGARPMTSSYHWQTDPNSGQVTGGVAPPPSYYAETSGTGSSAVDRILRRYGLL